MNLPSIQIGLTPEALALMKRVQDVPALMQVVAREVDLQMQLAVEHISEYRLRGQGPFPVSEHRLGVRSAKLWQSLRPSKAVISGDTVVATIGTNIRYAGAHEFGFSGTVTVGGHVRKRKVTREFLSKTGRAVRRRVRVADTIVGTHQRKMNIPERAPIRTGIEDCREQMQLGVSRAIIAHLKGGAA